MVLVFGEILWMFLEFLQIFKCFWEFLWEYLNVLGIFRNIQMFLEF